MIPSSISRSQLRDQRIAKDTANLARDTPIRERFHAWLLTEGYAPQATPKPGRSYPGSSAQGLWECYLAATVAEREINGQ